MPFFSKTIPLNIAKLRAYYFFNANTSSRLRNDRHFVFRKNKSFFHHLLYDIKQVIIYCWFLYRIITKGACPNLLKVDMPYTVLQRIPCDWKIWTSQVFLTVCLSIHRPKSEIIYLRNSWRLPKSCILRVLSLGTVYLKPRAWKNYDKNCGH